MNPRLRSILIGIGLLTLVIIAIVLIPRGLSIYYQSRGGQHIDYVMRSVEGIQELVCEPLPESNRGAIEEIEKGIEYLQRAVRFNGHSAQSYYHLGKAYCLLNSPSLAIEVYRKFMELNPQNPLGHLELAFAYNKYCITRQYGDEDRIEDDFNGTLICNNPEILINISDELRKANIGTDDLIREAKSNFFNDNIKFADILFRLAFILKDDLSQSELFLKELSQISLRNELSNTVLSVNFPVYSINGTTSIRAQDLLWIKNSPELGNFLDGNSSGDKEFGVMWANGTAIAVIDNPNPSKFIFSVLAQNSIPAPITLVLEKNFETLDQFPFDKGDLSWETMSTEFYLDEGLQIIGISFINDQKVGQLDRNAYIGWIEISPIP